MAEEGKDKSSSIENHDLDSLLNVRRTLDAIQTNMVATHSAGTTVITEFGKSEIIPQRHNFDRHAEEAISSIDNSSMDSARSRVRDMISDFTAYRSASLGIMGQLSKMLSAIPNWFTMLSNISAEVEKIRTDIVSGKVVVSGDEEIRKLAEMVVTIMVEGGYVVKKEGV